MELAVWMAGWRIVSSPVAIESCINIDAQFRLWMPMTTLHCNCSRIPSAGSKPLILSGKTFSTQALSSTAISRWPFSSVRLAGQARKPSAGPCSKHLPPTPVCPSSSHGLGV